MVHAPCPKCIHPPWLVLFVTTLVSLSLSLSAGAQGVTPPPAAPEVAPEIAFESAAVTFGGATPGGRVALFGIGRDRQDWTPRVTRLDDLVVADGEGAGRVDLDEPVIVRSVWAVIDVATGEYALAAPEGTELSRVELPAEGLGANLRFLEREGRFLDVLLVRPESGPEGEESAGVWGVAMGDGAGLDRDGEANGRLELDLASLYPFGDTGPAPLGLKPRDVLIGVDPQTLEVFAQRIADGPDEGPPGGGSANASSVQGSGE